CLVGERGLQRFGRSGRTHDRQVGPRNERRQEERKALDVIEMGVRDQEVRLQRLGGTEGVAELSDPRSRVDDQQVALRVADLDAGRVAAVAKGAASWSWSGAPRSPELDPHRTGA